MNDIQLKRVYEEAQQEDGFRILVDRLWPRGIKKEDLPYDLWAKEIAPSPEIRKAFNHEPEKFNQFRKDYLYELNENDHSAKFLERIKIEMEKQPVTLLYAAKNTMHNHAVILKEWMEQNRGG